MFPWRLLYSYLKVDKYDLAPVTEMDRGFSRRIRSHSNASVVPPTVSGHFMDVHHLAPHDSQVITGIIPFDG